MDYKQLSDGTLKELHQSVDKCLKHDDSLAPGVHKTYGVREYPDWKQHLDKIEAELANRGVTFNAINISPITPKPTPMPAAAVLYEKIRACKDYDANLGPQAQKLYGAVAGSDWERQAKALEAELNTLNYPYTQIIW